MSLPDKFLAVDPGEDTGWSVWSKDKLVTGGQTKIWDFSDCVWTEALRQIGTQNHPLFPLAHDEMPDLTKAISGISLLVVEEWRIYPWVAKTGGLDWDECRTARLIGSLYQACRIAEWDYEQQPAKIKERALAAGAEAYFEHPLVERRHTNDSRLHGIYYIAKQNNRSWTDLSTSEWEV